MNDVLELEIIKKNIAQLAHFSLGSDMILDLKPSYERLRIKKSLKQTQQAMEVIRLKGSLPLGGVHDIRSFAAGAMKNIILNEKELMMCASLMRACEQIKSFIQKSECDTSELMELCDSMSVDIGLAKKIESCISPAYEIYDNASAELKRIRKAISSTQAEITSQSAKFIQMNANKLTDTITTMRNDRVCVLVKISEKNTVKGFIHGESASGATAYVEPESLLLLNNKLSALKSAEIEEMKRILYDLSQEVKKYGDRLIANCETLGLLDCIFAKAQYGHNMKGCISKVNEEKQLYLKNARHPLIDPLKVVKNTYRMKDKTILLITGSNTGGKTVTLKTIGLFVLMSYCGFPVCADEAELPFFDAVYADIGDEQSIEQSLSTFSAHISKLAMITTKVSENALVILDELGSGTDPKEGEALAIAVLDYLREKNCMVLASTHYSKLKSVSSQWPSVLCSSVEFDMNTMKPTYRYIEGVSGASNALSIASHFGLEASILQKAQKIKDESETQEEKLIDQLNQMIDENRQLKEKLQSELILIEQQEQKLASQQEKLHVEKEKMLEEARQESYEIVSEARRRSDEIIAQLKEKGNAKIHELLKIREGFNELEKEEIKEESNEEFHVHDSVLIKKYNYYGEVLEVKSKYLLVLANGIKMKLDPSDCTKTAKKKEKKIQTTVSSKTLTRVSMECNVIGEKVADALPIVDKYLDSAILSRLYTVRIIHGVGSGALRSAIWDYLKKNKHVESYRIGGEGEGGTGATVVTLKGGNHGK